MMIYYPLIGVGELYPLHYLSFSALFARVTYSKLNSDTVFRISVT